MMPDMHVYDLTVPQLKLSLRNLDRWIVKAVEHADAKQIPHEQLLTARLAPDQFHFTKQVQTATDNAKFIPARLVGKQAPSHPDTETSFDQLRARVASIVEYLDTFNREELDNPTEKIVLPWMKAPQHLLAPDYVVQFALPNYYFHLTTAYAILRNQGVQLGKLDFIGPINMKME
jgi:hypothetical protein